ncbi:hypothetical protein GCM10010885_10860 [Alicyclobacillus cellulosilyticus]|uniref:Uracil-DNA glycosylase-like domain-containing protein n=1 Tax=Alicyclobacillus cellulosilyticus TaxID=1003997 RepID=A0A917KAS0_9BACL|nr:uracil-DNA glycosylase family protein [Alicyclobacillus cellulosilyticus]GGJ03442.1 hypothetical protein GCM10010885_10860 [Alicyclobacillus cellulosilyticus]
MAVQDGRARAAEDLKSLFVEVRQHLMQSYEVPDLIGPKSRLIFLLESPHVQELKYRAPVAGASGATMSKHLFGEAYAKFPVGLLVKKNLLEQKNRPSLDCIGLMNVSNIPLQPAAYRDRSVHEQYGDWLSALARIREDNQRDDYRDPLLNAVQAAMVEYLRDKLLALAERPCVVVPCGRFAQKFFRLAGVMGPRWQVIHGVPHPSYNAWDRAQYQSVIAEVQRALEQLRAATAGVAAAVNLRATASPDSQSAPSPSPGS